MLVGVKVDLTELVSMLSPQVDLPCCDFVGSLGGRRLNLPVAGFGGKPPPFFRYVARNCDGRGFAPVSDDPAVLASNNNADPPCDANLPLLLETEPPPVLPWLD
mmetsp:Transcript_31319/g.51712  ORF Transcript_31319/g.51712 Transcript_31319/m.51712 type:complete len:104 (-) Transcript_31319:975-1286(-)